MPLGLGAKLMIIGFFALVVIACTLLLFFMLHAATILVADDSKLFLAIKKLRKIASNHLLLTCGFGILFLLQTLTLSPILDFIQHHVSNEIAQIFLVFIS